MSLNRKILLVTIAILAVSLLVSSVATVQAFRKNYTEALLTGGFGIANSINNVLDEMLALGLPLDSLSGMNERLKRVIEQNEHIRYIGIGRLDGEVVFHSNEELVGRHFTDPVSKRSYTEERPSWSLYERFDGRTYYDVRVPVRDSAGERIAVLRLGFERGIVDDKVIEAVTHNGLIALATFAVITVLLNLYLRRRISDPIRRLSARAQRITDGQFDPPVTLEGDDELGRLSRSINKMALSLRTHITDLERARETLEQEVAERTHELADANRSLQANNEALSLAIEHARESEDALRHSEERFRRMFEDSGDALLLIEGDRFVECNDATLAMLGCDSRDYVIGRHPWELSPPQQEDGRASGEKAGEMIARALEQGTARFEWLHQRRNGEVFPVEVLLTPIDYRGKRLVHTVWRDITERKRAEAQIHDLAFYDPLTNLANRRLFLDRLEQALTSNDRTGHFGALMLFDLDHFKNLNDTQGHDVGDELLVHVGQRLRRCLRHEDTISRLGGDEFVVMLEDLGRERRAAVDHARHVADKIRDELNLPYLLAGQSEGYTVSFSLGVTVFGGSGETAADGVLKQADLALYRAKDAGRDTIRFFDPEMQRRVNARARLEGEIRRAIVTGEFQLHFQPQVDPAGALVGTEGLLRWQRPDGRTVSPGEFIPVAEDSGLILPLGYRVIEEACGRIAEWSRIAPDAVWGVSVNVSPRQLHAPGFVERVDAILSESRIDATRLKFEITESAILANRSDAKEKMDVLRKRGVRFSLDDFGTGYSSLSNLKFLPISEVKIDHSFVRDITADPNDAAIVQTILGMANSLGIAVVAEGVETIAQRDFLMAHGCQVLQGFLYGRAEPAEAMLAWFDKRNRGNTSSVG